MNSTTTGTSTASSGRAVRITAFALLTGALVVGAWIEPAPVHVSVCMSRILTGVGCPACGMTRAIVALKTGHVAESIRLHAFAIPFVVAGLVAWAALGLGFLLRRDLFPDLSRRRAQWTLLGVLAAFLVYWLARFARGTVQ